MVHETATSFTYLDFMMIGTVILSAIFGFFRGVTREVLTIGGWIMAALITLYGMDTVKPAVRSLIGGHPFVVDVVAILGLFVISLIVFSLIIRFISDKVKASGFGSLDRSLGLVFGGGRGVFILMIFFAFAVYLWPKPEERPVAMQQARLMDTLNKATAWMLHLLPHGLFDTGFMKALQPAREATPDEIVHSLATPQAGTLKKSGRHGYSSQDREKIDTLFAAD